MKPFLYARVNRLTLLIVALVVVIAIFLDRSPLVSGSHHLASLGHYLNYTALLSAALRRKN
jgi:hypothetical protein